MKYIRNKNCGSKWIHGVSSTTENSVGFSATDYEKLIAVTYDNQLVQTLKDVFYNYILERLRPRIFNCMKKCFLSAGFRPHMLVRNLILVARTQTAQNNNTCTARFSNSNSEY
jgi:hypothetical protein